MLAARNSGLRLIVVGRPLVEQVGVGAVVTTRFITGELRIEIDVQVELSGHQTRLRPRRVTLD